MGILHCQAVTLSYEANPSITFGVIHNMFLKMEPSERVFLHIILVKNLIRHPSSQVRLYFSSAT